MKIFLVSSTRADFGLLKNLILKFKKNYLKLKNFLQLKLNLRVQGTVYSHDI